MGTRTGNEAELLCISRNISERKRMEAHLYDLARRDALTNLPNRLLLEERVATALADAYRDRLFAGVLVIDLDRFKISTTHWGTLRGIRCSNKPLPG